MNFGGQRLLIRPVCKFPGGRPVFTGKRDTVAVGTSLFDSVINLSVHLLYRDIEMLVR